MSWLKNILNLWAMCQKPTARHLRSGSPAGIREQLLTCNLSSLHAGRDSGTGTVGVWHNSVGFGKAHPGYSAVTGTDCSKSHKQWSSKPQLPENTRLNHTCVWLSPDEKRHCWIWEIWHLLPSSAIMILIVWEHEGYYHNRPWLKSFQWLMQDLFQFNKKNKKRWRIWKIKQRLIQNNFTITVGWLDLCFMFLHLSRKLTTNSCT